VPTAGILEQAADAAVTLQQEAFMSFFGMGHVVSRGTVEQVAGMVESYFRKRNLDPHRQLLPESQGTGWWLAEGSAKVYIFVQETTTGPVLRITSPILHIPTGNRENFYRRLLDINADLSGCALATFDNVVLVVAQRPTIALDQEELDALVWNVAYVADLLDDKLATEFGAEMYWARDF
jgi:hypothetical protein